METTGAYGGGKAGGAFDPQQFVQKPPVIVRAVCWVSFSLIYYLFNLILHLDIYWYFLDRKNERKSLLEIFIK